MLDQVLFLPKGYLPMQDKGLLFPIKIASLLLKFLASIEQYKPLCLISTLLTSYGELDIENRPTPLFLPAVALETTPALKPGQDLIPSMLFHQCWQALAQQDISCCLIES